MSKRRIAQKKEELRELLEAHTEIEEILEARKHRKQNPIIEKKLSDAAREMVDRTMKVNKEILQLMVNQDNKPKTNNK